jgi:hypothetical protein
MTSERDRVISINLSESEWQAFVACQPKPVDWLRACIREAVAAASCPSGSRAQPATDKFEIRN